MQFTNFRLNNFAICDIIRGNVGRNMKQKYFQILELLQEQSNALPRLQEVHEIVKHPDFHYENASAADFVLDVFLKSSYWLDRELFDESYLYSKERQNLSPTQMVHLKMVEIGASLMDKGFPVRYNPSEYAQQGPDQMSSYVKILVEQIHKKHARRILSNGKRSIMSSNRQLSPIHRQLSR